LKKGIVKEYDISKQGNEQITWLINALEVFPFPWLMNSVPTVTYYYETVSDCEVYILKKEEYVELLENNKQFLYSELKRQANKENAQSRRLAAILNSKAENKLVNTFHYLIESYGIVIKKGSTKVDITLTHQDIANLTGLTRETVSKELSKLKRKGIISQINSRDNYTVNLGKLNELLSTPLSNLYS
jgi:CRP-like cAMP-binding protein